MENEIKVYEELPTAPGLYIVKWHFTGEVQVIKLYHLKGDDKELHSAGGASTHFSRWHCHWSKPITIFAPYGLPLN